jgi:hypothetical protein
MSTNKRETDPQLRLDESEDALVFPPDAPPTDDSPTIISSSRPTIDLPPVAKENVTDLAARGAAGDGLVASLRGRRLAHFELIEPIGVGGMAAVLRARDTQLDRQVALKILPPEMAADPDNVQRFHQEAKAAARLDHENIARVFFCGEDQGLHFIAFEFVEGENLRALLERRGRLPVPEAVRYVLQVATGLEHAAARGVVHRDVKPSNIIISPNGRAKLVDMGLARNIERSGDLTHSGVTLGTFDYISPEQALEPREADARSDIYSLGCTFYHMITGQVPVPEGTAAKKLHHHQHVAPIDPRQLNPDIPDEIAVILGRMMAKDPRARYQRPLQLVQHLMQAARHVGVADDLPEGVLFVDAPLPAGPRSRPLLIVSMVVLALGIIMVLLALSPRGDNQGQVPVPPGPAVSASPGGDKKGNGGDTAPKPVTNPAVLTSDSPIRDVDGLVAAARDPKLKERSSIKLKGGEYDVTRVAGALSLAAGPALVVEPESPGAKVKIKVQADAQHEAFVLAGGNITFRNLIFQIAASDYPDADVAAIAIRGAERVVFEKCVFEQQIEGPPFNPAKPGIVSLLIEPDPAARLLVPHVEFNECYFTGDKKTPDSVGEIAIAINGPADVRARNCGFKPHGAFFQFREHCRRADTVVRLDQCSGFACNGPVFRFEAKAGADLQPAYCIFSRLGNNAPPKFNEPNLIWQADGDEKQVGFHGKENRFHNLNALWIAGPSIKNTIEQFREALKGSGSSYDQGSEVIEESPWSLADPLLREMQPQIIFQVKPEYAAFGLQKGPWGDLPRAAAMEIVLAPGTKLLDPDYKGKPAPPGVYASMDRALANMDAGETLLVKPGKDGREIEVSPTNFSKPGVDFTIKAFEKTSPVLSIGKIAEKKDIAFFRMLDGKLRFEGLHFLLEPRQEGVTSESVLLLGDSAQCTFERCAFTLKASRRVPIVVVAFVDPKDIMKVDPPRPMSTRVQFTGCFIRGDGDLVNMTGCRPLKLALENSLLAVAGSLAAVQSSGEDVAADQGPEIVLNKVSTFTREPTFSFRASRNGKGLARVHIEARTCLFAPLADRPLVFLEASDVMSEEHLAKYLEWKTDPKEQNCFTRFDKLLEQERPNEIGSTMQLDPVRWGKLFGETKLRNEDMTFPQVPADLILSQAVPGLFRPNDPETASFGVDADALNKVEALVKALK